MSLSHDASPTPRDRFVVFAFAAAELLVELALDGTITFAAGAFPARFGAAPERFVGRHLASLVAPADQTALAMALATTTLRGRVPPLIVHLADLSGTPVSLAALMMPGPPPRLSVTLGRMPASPASSAPATGFDEPMVFVREADQALRSGADGRLGLVEIEGWQAAKEALSVDDQRRLRASIAETLAAAGSGVVSGQLAEGRFGVLGSAGLDIAALAGRLRDLVCAGPAARLVRISDTALSLTPGGLTPAQAARTLRYAITRFVEGGTAAAREDGTAAGLSGVILQSEQRALAMREAITAHRFRLQFQPIVALEERAVHHYEALLRPARSELPPSRTTQDFVLFAEMVGLSEELDLAVLTETLTTLRAAPTATVAANISGLSIQSPDFSTRFGELLAEHADVIGTGEAPRRLLVELTETAEIENMGAAAGAVAALRAEGIPVCLDDFGAGAAAFRYLREFGVDYVKIDGSYVGAAVRSARERGFAAAMVELAGTMGARVVAEMVETEEQAALMCELGVQYGQGWLFGRPGSLPGARR